MKYNEGKTEQITFRLKPEEKKCIEEYCAANDIPVSQFIRKLIKNYMEDRKNGC